MPGERSGSASFATATGIAFPKRLIAIAEALGAFAFEAVRALTGRRGPAWIRQIVVVKRGNRGLISAMLCA